MKAFLTVVSTVAVVLASQASIADTLNPIVRTDRITIVKPAAKTDSVAVEQVKVQRTDRIGFTKTEIQKATADREVVRRSDRIVFTKTQG